jgi:hypothetical protein
MPWIMKSTRESYNLAARLAVEDCWILEWSVRANVKGGRDSVQIGDRVWFAILEEPGTFGTIIGRGRILSKVVDAISPERDLSPAYCPNPAEFPEAPASSWKSRTGCARRSGLRPSAKTPLSKTCSSSANLRGVCFG